MLRDFEYALRSLRKAPGLTLIAVLSMALGIGANTAIFTLTDAVLLRSLPVRDPERLALFRLPNPAPVGFVHGATATSLSYPMYRQLRDRNQVFTGIVCRGQVQLSLTHNGESERLLADLVSGNFFEVLRVSAAAGRLFTESDDHDPGGHPVAVLSHGYWMRRFGGNRGIVGSTVLINAQPATVIGVAAVGFQGIETGTQKEIFVPMAMAPVYLPGADRLPDARRHWVQLIGRLKPGIDRPEAEAGINVLYRQLLLDEATSFDADVNTNARQYWLAQKIGLEPGGQGLGTLRRQSEKPLQVLTAAVGFVLLIACANVANLLLGRGVRKSREFGIRVALGAPRFALIRQVLAESVLLSLLGGFLGILLAYWGILGIRKLLPAAVSLPNNLAPDERVLLFTLALSIATGILAGIVPAWRTSRGDINAALKTEATGIVAGGRRKGMRGALVIGQVGLSLVLLVGAALFLKSLRNLRDVELGFDREGLLLASVNPSLSGYTQERAHAFFDALRERVRALPGVREAALAKVPVVGNANWSGAIQIEGRQTAEGNASFSRFNWVSPGFFRTLKVPLIEGRDISERDHEKASKVAVVNETFALRYFANASPIGRRVSLGGRSSPLDIEIVGVVKDSKYKEPKELPTPTAYFPYRQSAMPDLTLHVRAAATPESLTAAIRRELQALDAKVPLYDFKTIDAHIDETMTNERLMAALTTGFGALATVLAAVGLYGVLAFSVARRTREIGIRMALGAERNRVLWMVLKETLVLAGIGVLLGISGAWALTRYLESLLYEVKPMEPAIVATGVAAILAVSLASGFLPARRAARTDPMHALRYE